MLKQLMVMNLEKLFRNTQFYQVEHNQQIEYSIVQLSLKFLQEIVVKTK